jgi:hypothetical protein
MPEVGASRRHGARFGEAARSSPGTDQVPVGYWSATRSAGESSSSADRLAEQVSRSRSEAAYQMPKVHRMAHWSPQPTTRMELPGELTTPMKLTAGLGPLAV